MCEPGNRDNGARDVWALTVYSFGLKKKISLEWVLFKIEFYEF